jgi:hypothetical protein
LLRLSRTGCCRTSICLLPLELRCPFASRLLHIDERRRRLGQRRGDKPRREQNDGNIRAHDALFLLMLYAQEDCGNPEDAFARLNASPTLTFPQDAATQWWKLGYSQAITI